MKHAISIILLSSVAVAGEASVSDEFVIDAPFAKVTEWIDSHGPAMRDAINVELLEQDGEVYKLRRQNSRGVFVWRQRERIDRRADEWRLRSILVDCLEGGISRLDGHVVVTPDGPGATKITAQSAATISTVRSRDVEFDLKSRARRLRKLMEEELQ